MSDVKRIQEEIINHEKSDLQAFTRSVLSTSQVIYEPVNHQNARCILFKYTFVWFNSTGVNDILLMTKSKCDAHHLHLPETMRFCYY